jgi:hypothetical protein
MTDRTQPVRTGVSSRHISVTSSAGRGQGVSAPGSRTRKEAHRRAAREHRQRVKNHQMTAVVTLDGAALDWLIRVHALEEADLRGSRRQIRAKVGIGLSNLVRVSSRA